MPYILSSHKTTRVPPGAHDIDSPAPLGVNAAVFRQNRFQLTRRRGRTLSMWTNSVNLRTLHPLDPGADYFDCEGRRHFPETDE